jgi:cystathionine gamma-synthase
MPLNPHHPAVVPADDGLEDPVLRPRHRLELRSQVVHPLVVMRVDLRRVAVEYLGEHAGRVDRQLMGRLGARTATVAIVIEEPGVVGEVLIERATVVDVEQLHAVADREDGQVPLHRRLDERQLEAVPSVAYAHGPRMPWTPVPGRVDVSAAGKQQAGGAVQGGGVLGVDAAGHLEVVGDLLLGQQVEGRDDLGPAPSGLDRLDVGQGETAVVHPELAHDGDPAVVARVIQSVDQKSSHMELPMPDRMRFETLAIHAGQDPDPSTGAAVVPIYQTSTYVQQAVGKHKGFEYSRTDNPTRRALESCLGALEGAAHAVAFGSGMAAISALAMTLEAGARVLIPDDVYGGTYRLFAKVMNRLGIAFEPVDMTEVRAVEAACAQGADMLVLESPTNPLLKVLDLRALADVGRRAGARVIVDNTFATPYVQRPLALGADAVVYSATKYLGGHSDLVAGAVTTSDDALAERLRFLQNSVGAILGPFDSWLLLRGLKTLAVRMRAHCLGAGEVARWLVEHDRVTAVHYPGLESFPSHEVAGAQMNASGRPLYGGMVSFEVDDERRALAVCEGTELFFLGESLGGVESLIEHPAKMTHASLEGSGMEVPPNLVRLSVGIEHPDDLIADLARALG